MTDSRAPVVDVQVACADGEIPTHAEIASWVSCALAECGDGTGAELSVRLVDKEEMQALNRDFRHTDKPTNVLSFPAGAIEGLPEETPRPLGDVVVCAAVVRREAADQGKALDAHWAHMLVHGTLHLLGYDHESKADAAEMEALETRILLQCGFAEPYGESR